MRSGRVRLVAVAGVLLLGGALPFTAFLHRASAAVTTVPCTGNPTTDGNTLANAVATADLAPGDDTLQLQACTYQLASTLRVTAAGDTLTVTGGSIDGAGAVQLLDVAPQAHLVVTATSLVGGEGGTAGGGAVHSAGALDLADVTLSGNHAETGGAVWSGGTTHVLRTLFDSNGAAGTSTLPGHGNHVFVSAGLITVDQSTLVNADASRGAGAIWVDGGSASLLGSTWSHNADYTIYNAAGVVSARNDVLADTGNTSNCYGTVTDNGGNFSNDVSCGFTDATSRNSINLPLMPLGSYGGLTKTMPPGPGSPAINGGGTSCGPTDQRGTARPQGSACDSGAVESASALRLSPVNAQYESTPAGSTSTQTFTVTSAGNDSLALGQTGLTGSSAYRITRDTCSGRVLAPTTTCAIDVRFSPTDTTPQSAQLAFVDNSYDGPHIGHADGVATRASPSPSPTSPTPAPSPTDTATPTPTSSPTDTATPTPTPTPSPTDTATQTPTPTPSPTDTATPTPTPTPSPTDTAGPSASATPIPSGRGGASPGPGGTAAPEPNGRGAAPDPSASALPPPGPAAAPGGAPDAPGTGPGAPGNGPAPGTRDTLSSPALFFTSYVPPPNEVSLGLTALVGSSLLALLLLALLSLPVTIVNDTLTEHREDVAEQLAWLRRRLSVVPRLPMASLPAAAALVLTAMGGAVINSLVDPGFGLNRSSAIDFVGLLSSLLLLTVVTRLCCDTFCERRFRAASTVRVLPGFWLLALTCVLLSRSTGFRPGLILGTLAAVQVSRALNTREEGEKTAFAYLVTAGTALLAWLAYAPVTAYVERAGHAGFGMLVLQTVLATLFLGGVGGSLFGLVPLDFLDGGTLRRWNPWAWFGLFFAALLGFVHVLLRHGSRDDPLLENVGYLEVLLAVYLLCATAFWGYWRWHDRRASRTGAGTPPVG